MVFRKSISSKLVQIAQYIDPETVALATNQSPPDSDGASCKSSQPETSVVAIKREEDASILPTNLHNSTNSDNSTKSVNPTVWEIKPIPVGVSINMCPTPTTATAATAATNPPELPNSPVKEDTEEGGCRDRADEPFSAREDDSQEREEPVAKKPRVRNEGCDYLAERYSFEADRHAEFDEPTHKYTVHGKAVHRSVTGLVHSLFEPFNGNLIVSKHYASWKERDDPRYKPFIEQATNESGLVDDEQAKRLIVQSWTNEGKKASDLGTKMHLYAEQVLNWNEADGTPRPTPHEDVSAEGVQFDAFMASDFVKERELEPIRTELTVFYMRGGVVVTAGQIDALFRSKKTQQYYIIDWKRIKPDKRIDAAARAFRNGLGFASSIPDTQHYQYSLQTSIYSLMLRESHGIDAEDNLYLVRMHADRSQGYELVKCTDLRPLAHQVLTHEYMSLSKFDQPDQ